MKGKVFTLILVLSLLMAGCGSHDQLLRHRHAPHLPSTGLRSRVSTAQMAIIAGMRKLSGPKAKLLDVNKKAFDLGRAAVL